MVDDNEDDIALLRIAFSRAQSLCALPAVLSGEAALRHLRACGDRPDLVMLDWKMPGTSGAEVLQAIRADPDLRGLPVIVFSSSDDPGDVRAAYALGASCYVPKPVDMAAYIQLARDLDAFWCRAVMFPLARRPVRCEPG